MAEEKKGYRHLTRELQTYIQHELEGENRLKHLVALNDEIISALKNLEIQKLQVNNHATPNPTFYEERSEIIFKNSPFGYFASYEVNKENTKQRNFLENSFVQKVYFGGDNMPTQEEKKAVAELLSGFDFCASPHAQKTIMNQRRDFFAEHKYITIDIKS